MENLPVEPVVQVRVRWSSSLSVCGVARESWRHSRVLFVLWQYALLLHWGGKWKHTHACPPAETKAFPELQPSLSMFIVHVQ